MESRPAARSLALVGEIGDYQAPTRLEHTGDFRESLTLEASWQMVQHQGREDHIEHLIREGQVLDHPDLELDRHVAPGCFCAGTRDLLWTWINTCHAERAARAACHCQRQRACAAPHIQHLVTTLQAGPCNCPPPQIPYLPSEQEVVEEPSMQVVAPTSLEDQSLCLLAVPGVVGVLGLCCLRLV